MVSFEYWSVTVTLGTVFEPYREKTAYKEEDDKDEEEKPKSIFERENIFRKPFEEKD